MTLIYSGMLTDISATLSDWQTGFRIERRSVSFTNTGESLSTWAIVETTTYGILLPTTKDDYLFDDKGVVIRADKKVIFRVDTNIQKDDKVTDLQTNEEYYAVGFQVYDTHKEILLRREK